MNYSELNLDQRLFSAIEKMGYKEATPIQEQAIPIVLEGKDVAGLAQTGTGKTAAFVIPLIERILRAETDPSHPRAFPDWKAFNSVLILVPTRELAEQIHENIVKIAEGTGIKSAAIYGGTGYEKQKEALSKGLQFIVSTPGRLIDLYKENFVDFKKVKAIVFDEADRMFDMGFKDDMKYILGRIERNRQFLVFSATLNFDVLNTAYQFGSEPVEINISKDQAKADHVKDFIFHIGNNEKPQHLISLFRRENPKQAIVFTNFKNSVDRIAQLLTLNGIPSMGISSLISQAQRNQVMTKFKEENNLNVLVATDVAARGLDITGVDLVINFELPQDCESYVHRIGRTGRAGNDGKAFSFVGDKDVESLSRIEDYTKKKIEVVFLEDAELVKDFKEPDFQRAPSYEKHFERGDKSSKSGPKHGDFKSSDRPRRDFKNKFDHKADGKNQSRNDSRNNNRNDINASAGEISAKSKKQGFDKSKTEFRSGAQGDGKKPFNKKGSTQQSAQNSSQSSQRKGEFAGAAKNGQHQKFINNSPNKNQFRKNSTSTRPSAKAASDAGVLTKLKKMLKGLFS